MRRGIYMEYKTQEELENDLKVVEVLEAEGEYVKS